MDIINALKQKGIEIEVINENKELLFKKDDKQKLIPLKDMEQMLLNSIINWFTY